MYKKSIAIIFLCARVRLHAFKVLSYFSAESLTPKPHGKVFLKSCRNMHHKVHQKIGQPIIPDHLTEVNANVVLDAERA